MGLLNKLLGKSSQEKMEFKSKLKQAQEEDKINRIITERAKSANQREVERYMNEQKEKQYKEVLDKIRKKNNSDMWSSKDNMILKKDKSILKDTRPILKEKNIFKMGKKKNKSNCMFMR